MRGIVSDLAPRRSSPGSGREGEIPDQPSGLGARTHQSSGTPSVGAGAVRGARAKAMGVDSDQGHWRDWLPPVVVVGLTRTPRNGGQPIVMVVEASPDSI